MYCFMLNRRHLLKHKQERLPQIVLLPHSRQLLSDITLSKLSDNT
jgi:hypothetical protein